MPDAYQIDHCSEEGLREVVRHDLRGCAWVVSGIAALLIPVAVLAVGWWMR